MDRATPALDGFKEASFSFQGHSKRVWVSGAGPAVIVMSEMPGISPRVVRFARGVRDAGFTVWLPSLFGRDGAVPEAEAGAQVFRRACVSSEFRVLAGGGSSPVTEWLRGLSR
ncbi:MAG: dienelactone hydrolase, partial [Myxococcota bacterium]